MTTRESLVFDDYLYIDLPSVADIALAEKKLKVKFPAKYCDVLLKAAGMSPENLEPVTLDGRKLGFRCFNHVFLDSEEPHKVNTDALEAWGYENTLLEFADNGGGVRYCLDYRSSPDNPPVIVVYERGENGSEESLERIADNFTDFLDKYTVPVAAA